MKATYDDYMTEAPNCRKFLNNEDMQEVFAYLSQDESIFRMVDACEAGRPALEPVAAEVEAIFGKRPEEGKPTLEEDFTKQAVGMLVRTILKPFGYVVATQKNLSIANLTSEEIKNRKFRSASVYRFDEDAPRSLRIVRRIEPVS